MWENRYRQTREDGQSSNSSSTSKLRPRAQKRASEPSHDANDTKPTPVYHRHKETQQSQTSGKAQYHRHPANIISLPRNKSKPSRLSMFLPLVLFGFFIGIAFLNSAPQTQHQTHSSAMMQMLHSSRLRGDPRAQGQMYAMTEPLLDHDPVAKDEGDASADDEAATEESEDEVPTHADDERIIEGDSVDHDTKVAQTGAIQQGNGSIFKESDHVPIIPPQQKAESPFVLTLENVGTRLQSSNTNNVLKLYLNSTTNSSSGGLITQEFPIPIESNNNPLCQKLPQPSLFLPIDNFPSDDPYLPWIHDYFHVPPSPLNSMKSGGQIQFVAQNKRRCETGKDKEDIMKHWESQLVLFQSIPIAVLSSDSGHPPSIRIADSVENATIRETRFVCHFHSLDSTRSYVTFSSFNFNYEYVLWRKRDLYKGMFLESGKDVQQFELSQLLFSCPVPVNVTMTEHGTNPWYLDLIPFRTPVRKDEEMLMTRDHIGEELYLQLSEERKHGSLLNDDRIKAIVSISDFVQSSGRWAMLPVCLANQTERVASSAQLLPAGSPKRNNFVVCTWTAANYFRRGDATSISDSARRLREWVAFHQLVGVDHIYVYDNTRPPNDTTTNGFVSPLKKVVEDNFSPLNVTYMPWPCEVCSNNRPNHPNPGERSSQYAAEASCRERFGSFAEWMAFIDQDEYLVPMMAESSASNFSKRVTSWTPVLEKKRKEGYHVLKMRSSRGRPRVSLMETIVNDTNNVCFPSPKSRFQPELCLQSSRSHSFLRLYNCEYIRPPKPDRFQRAMKQIYRPEFVKSHYVHYSTVTKPMTEYHTVRAGQKKRYSRRIQDWEWGDVFLDDLNEGCLVHAKSVIPHETIYRSSICKNASKLPCPVGFECPDSTPFVDLDHTKNIAHDGQGNYCNCWINHHLEDTLIPLLENSLQLSKE